MEVRLGGDEYKVHTPNKCPEFAGWNKTIDLEIPEGRDLTNLETLGTSDPFVVVKFMSEEYRSRVVKSNVKHPVWGFSCRIGQKNDLAKNPHEKVTIQVWDRNTISDDVIGEVSMVVGQLTSIGQPRQQILEGAKVKKKNANEISVKWTVNEAVEGVGEEDFHEN